MIVTSRKKFTAALALTLAIFFGSIFILNPAAQAAALKDLNQCADYAKPAVDRLAQSGVISGDQNGYFNPQQSISRAQMVTLIVKSLGLDKTITPDKNNSFQDVPRTHWANQYVEIAYQAGITSGVAPGQFGANQSCTREQMITLFVNSFKLQDNDFSSIPSGLIDLSTFADADKISDWAYNPVAFSVYMGLINGTSATTMDPKIAAQRQQVAVLIDRFIDKKDSIVNDMQAQRILGKTVKEQFNGEGISNTGKVEIKVNLQEASLGFPAEFSLKAQVINEALWPATLHQYVKMELTGLPHNDFPAWEMEQYLVDGVLYQKIPDADNDASWSTMSPEDTPDINKFMEAVKNARIKQLFLPDEIHKSIDVKLEDTEVNGTDGHKITYTGQTENFSVLLDQILAGALPENMESSEFIDLLDIIKQAIKSISFSEVLYVGDDNRIYGNQYVISIDCNDTAASQAIPFKSVVITGNYDNFKYSDINIKLPADAQAAL